MSDDRRPCDADAALAERGGGPVEIGPVTVRRALPRELNAVLGVLDEARAALGALGIDQWQDGYPAREQIADDIARSVSYVAVDEDGALLGAAAIDFSGEPTYDVIDGEWLTSSSSQAPRYGVIHRIGVAERARRRGVASSLIDAAYQLALAQGAESLRIDTHPGNMPMQALIESRGFAYCGVIQIDLARESTKERLAYELVVTPT